MTDKGKSPRTVAEQIADRVKERAERTEAKRKKRRLTVNKKAAKKYRKKAKAKKEAAERKYQIDNKDAIEAEAKAKAEAAEEARKAHKEKIAAERKARDSVTKEERVKNKLRRELASRELSRRRLIAYVIRSLTGYQAGWVHKEICLELEQFLKDVRAGLSPRLMIQMPPRHGKSELASKRFPAWVLGQFPELEIIACSYSASLAEEFSREVREQIEDPEFQVVFPKAVMNKDKRNITGWKTTKGGGFLPAGVGGPITGKGADILIIDDPIKNAEEAESDTTRETIWKWFTSTAYTRLAPGGGILVIQTRWHDDDLSGRLESAMDAGEGDEYRIIRYPAEALRNEKYRRTGQALHKERYPETALAKIKRAVGPRTWEALYQQNPTPDEGMFFNNEMFRYYGKDHPRPPDEELVFYTAWDLAIGKKEQNDYTVGATWGMDMNGDLWIVDMRRGRWDAHEISTELCDNYERWGSQIVGVEKGQISLAIGPYLEELIDERGLNALYIEELPPGKRDKIARARTTQGLMRRGRVWFPTADTCVWVNEMVFEMKRFPNGANDDIVDAVAWLGLLLPQTTGPNVGSPSVQVSGWRARLKGIVDVGRKRSAMSA